MTSASVAIGRQIADEVVIPPRPEIVKAVSEEAQKASPNIHRIGNLISADVSLVGAILQVVNSPAYGLEQKITSIQQGCLILGPKRVARVVALGSMHKVAGQHDALMAFRVSATEVACIASFVAPRVGQIAVDDAYALGLLSEVGKVLMSTHFDGYRNQWCTGKGQRLSDAIAMEQKAFGTSHAEVGFALCERWLLPDRIARAVRDQHKLDELIQARAPALEQTVTLMCVMSFSAYLSRAFHQAVPLRDDEWQAVGTSVLCDLGLDEVKARALRNQVFEWLRDGLR